jgi:hypothetical protein
MPVVGTKRGRPARYHNATCRQRAHRAGRANRHDAALRTLASLEEAASALRHALITDKDTADAHSRIIERVAELSQQLDHATSVLHPISATVTSVTESVTTPQLTPHRDSTDTTSPAAASDIRRAATDQSEPSNSETPPTRVTKMIDMRDTIGPGWALLQHEGDADASIWRVHHNGRVVGTVSRAYELISNTRGWEARTAHHVQVPAFGKFAASRRNDRLWRTRDSAAAGIALHLDRPSTSSR